MVSAGDFSFVRNSGVSARRELTVSKNATLGVNAVHSVTRISERLEIVFLEVFFY